MLTLADIIEALSGLRPAWATQVISQAVIDSRHVNPGCIFVALPGDHGDGHDFIGEAFQKGATAALVHKENLNDFKQIDLRQDVIRDIPDMVEPPFCLRVNDSLEALQKIARFWRQRRNLRVIGITGSVGKSTTKEMIAEVLSQKFRTLKNPGNLNNEIGLPLTLLSLSEHHERAVLEMGFYVPGEIKFLCDIAMPQIGVITNVGTVHAERAGSQEAIARGKAELVQALPPAPEGVAVLNYDDQLVRDMAEMTKARVFFYGLHPEADLWADQIEGLGLEGIRVRLHYLNEVFYLRVPLLGRHSVHTVLRATAVGLLEGLTWQEIVEGLRSENAQLRLVAVYAQSGALLLDDTYNASPESTLAALNLLDELDGHKIAVLGDMLELGQYAEHGHELVGIRASQVADEIITIGALGRIIARKARQAGFSSDSIKVFEETAQAISYLSNRLKKEDVVLVKGSRGMRMDAIVTALEEKR